MKIEGRKSSRTGPVGSGAVPVPGQAGKVEAPAPAADDLVEISSTSREIGELKNALSAVPDVNLQKVESIRGAIEEGSYHVESEKLAKRVVDQALEDALYRHRSLREMRPR